MKLKYIAFLLVILLTTSFQTTDQTEVEKLSVLVVKLRYQSHGMTGFGGSLKVRNLETNEIFQNKSKIGFNPFVIVENLPVGSYKVEALEVISGSNILTLRNEFDFNTLKLDTSMVYYLGSYMATKIPPLMGLNFQVARTENDNPKEIYKQLKKKSDNWQKLSIDFQQSVLVSDTTIIKM
jgi:hypothetical protein